MQIIAGWDTFKLLLMSCLCWQGISTQPAITCSKLTIETLEQRCEICSKLTIKTPKRRHWAFQMKNLVQYFTITYRITHRRYSIKKLFLKRSQYSQETAVLESLANKVASFQDSKTIIFLWILHFFYIKTYFEEHLWKVASDFNTSGNRY